MTGPSRIAFPPCSLALLCAGLLIAACSSDEGQGNASISVRDGAVPDGGGDGGSQPPREDAAEPEEDGGTIVSGGTYLCRFDEDDVHAWSSHVQRQGLSMATDERGFALLHHDEDGALAIEALPLGEEAQPSVRLVAASDAPGHALLAVAQERFGMLWRSGATLSFRVLQKDADPVVVSEQPVTSAAGEPLFALLGLDERFVALFAEREGDELSVLAQAFDLDGQALDDAARVELPDVSEMAALKLAALDDSRLLLAWSTPDGDEGFEVLGLMLSSTLEAEGDPQTLTKVAASSARFELDARVGSAGVLYQTLEGGERQSVKLQRVEPDGTATQPALNLANAPRRAIDASITAFGQGYAAAYRALPSLGASDPTIQIAFIDATGLIVHQAELAETTETAGTTSVRSTARGELLVSWTTASPSTLQTHALALDCPGALVLCGGSLE